MVELLYDCARLLPATADKNQFLAWRVFDLLEDWMNPIIYPEYVLR